MAKRLPGGKDREDSTSAIHQCRHADSAIASEIRVSARSIAQLPDGNGRALFVSPRQPLLITDANSLPMPGCPPSELRLIGHALPPVAGRELTVAASDASLLPPALLPMVKGHPLAVPARDAGFPALPDAKLAESAALLRSDGSALLAAPVAPKITGQAPPVPGRDMLPPALKKLRRLPAIPGAAGMPAVVIPAGMQARVLDMCTHCNPV